MKKSNAFIISLLITVSLSLGGIQDVEAKRFGGARSFGGKHSYSQPLRRSTFKPQRSANRQQAHAQNQAARQTMSRRGGLMGLLGGLALGGLLGSLFFGGAFEGLNFIDLVIFGGLAYLLYKLFAAKTQAVPRGSYQRAVYDDAGSDYQTSFDNDDKQHQTAGFDTDVLFDKVKKSSPPAQHINSSDADFDDAAVPGDFNQRAFLEGAKSAFRELQSAWDNKNLAEIRGLTTDKVFAEIQQQINADSGVNRTEILKIDAELLDYREIGADMETVVLFDTIIREDVSEQAQQIREIWHFIKAKNSLQPTWFLNGIQQMEN